MGNEDDLLAQYIFLYAKASACKIAELIGEYEEGGGQGRARFRFTGKWERAISAGCFACCILASKVAVIREYGSFF